MSTPVEPPVPVAPPRRRWFRRDVVATTHLCPKCKVAGKELLLQGQLCRQCLSAEAWTEHDGAVLKIDHGVIDAAMLRRAGEAAGEPLWRKVIVWIPPAIAVVVALFAAWSLYRMFAARPIGPLRALLDDLVWSVKRAALVGAAAIAVGITGMVLLRRRRHFRQIPMLVSYALPLIAGLAAFSVGTLQLVFGDLDFGTRYVSMPTREPLGVTATVERIVNATVVVLAPDQDGNAFPPALGTGAIVAADDKRAWIVTCSHVAMPYAPVGAYRHAKNAQPVWIQLADGREGKAFVRWAAPPPLDVVVIELPITDAPTPVPIAPSASELEVASSVTFVPLPYRSGWKVVHGQLLRRERHATPAGDYDLLYTDLPVTFGDSGSGLFDARGQLVGLNTWTRVRGDAPSQGISLPSEAMHALVAAIEAGKLDQLDDSILPQLQLERE